MVKAVIMAGGEGTRLRPLTVNRPKPLVPLVNKPIMEHVVHLLKTKGFKDIGVTLHYLPNTIMRYFGDGSEFGVKIYYSIEEKPLGTAGGVRFLVDRYGWDETIIVISGDVFTNIDLEKMLEYHRRKGSIFTMAVRKTDDPTKYGIALLDEEGRVRRFLEKPSWSEVFSDLINMGIYIIEPEALEMIPPNEEYDFAKNLIPKLLRSGKPVYGWRADKYYWSDIGSINQYKDTHNNILSGKVKIDTSMLGSEVAKGVYVGENTSIDNIDNIIPPVVIGKDTRIKKNTVIGPFTVIGSNNIIESGVRIEKSIIWDYSYIGPASTIIDSIICNNVHVRDHVAIMEGAVIGDDTRIGRGSIIRPNIKIWPSKIIDPYTIVSINIKWGIRWYKTLIEPWGITGLLNIEITPELASRIGSAFGSSLPRNSSVVVARDTYASSRIVKHGIVAGLMSSGINVYDLEVSPLPVLTNYIKKKKLKGGIHVSSLVYDPLRIRIKIFDHTGKFITRTMAKKIENIFFKEAFRKVLGDQVGDLYPTIDHIDQYISDISTHISFENIREQGRVLIDCNYGSAGSLWPRLVRELGLTVYQVNCNEQSPIMPPREPFIHASVDSAIKIIPLLGLSAGFIYDSDADKLIVITDSGKVVSGDHLIALVAKILLETRGRGKIVIPHNSSRVVIDTIREYGGETIFAEQGLMGLSEHINENILMAADERGGIIYPWLHYGSDAIFTSLLILEYLGSTGYNLSTLLEQLPKTTVIKKTIVVPYAQRGRFMRIIYEELKEKEIDTLDGIKIVEENLGSGYIRPLPNEPLIEIIAESDNQERAEKLAKMLLDLAYKIKSKL
ncbi:mannose-1-phosphate guanyltransferase [Staphylothermus hellenicus]|uniref:Nucleotidyl transferase n=1 Tax=Staphylothermus hellenicus (strain DSM 12710 / JCM 10830 / BK20S6-10-b1 / P8) TaxID=591019 RepID=D7DC47_STAHD|nr:mannose-1-phosphate guanyltransferase [Staphylothermus hellenicus]ADI31744.1 Nucleotidyl transferase [Staphylothermus hellenicus DSM 12710]